MTRCVLTGFSLVLISTAFADEPKLIRSAKEVSAHALISDEYDNDSARPGILCRIAHIHSDCSISDCKDVDARLVSELSNSDQLSLSI